MEATPLTITQQLAAVLVQLQEQRTGHVPKAVAVVLSEDTLVVTIHDTLTLAEQSLARTPAGSARVQEFHRQLFASSSEEMRKEIKRITGRQVQEAAAEVETATGTVVHAFTTGAMVQVFLLVPETLIGKASGGKQAGSQRTERLGGLKGFVQDLESLTIENENFCQVLYTARNCQLAVMLLKPLEETSEGANHFDQVLRVEEGTGEFMLDDVRKAISAGSSMVVPAGATHKVTNTGNFPLKLSMVYSPPNHQDRAVQVTPKEACSGNEYFDGRTTE